MRKKQIIEQKLDIVKECLDVLKPMYLRALNENEHLSKCLTDVSVENDKLRIEIEEAYKENKELKKKLKTADSEVFRLNGIVDINLRENRKLTDRLNKLQESYECEITYRKALHKRAKDDVISEFNARIYAYSTGFYIKGEELIIIPSSDYEEILKELAGKAE